MVHFPKRDLSEASLALERGYHLTRLLARLSVNLADEASRQHRPFGSCTKRSYISNNLPKALAKVSASALIFCIERDTP